MRINNKKHGTLNGGWTKEIKVVIRFKLIQRIMDLEEYGATIVVAVELGTIVIGME